MAVYTTLFTVSDADLATFFPGWRKPKRRPGKAKGWGLGEEWDPGRDPGISPASSLLKSQGRKPLPPITPPEDDYPKWLDKAAPALLRTFPHLAIKTIASAELLLLGKAVLGKNAPPARFVDCAEEEGFIGPALPTASLKRIAALPESEILGLAQARKAEIAEGDNVGGLEWTLRRIRLLAIDAAGLERHLFAHARC
jgi:hypothetical protein